MRVKRKDLARAVKLVRGVVDGRSPIPAYRSLLLAGEERQDGPGLAIHGTDGWSSLSMWIEVEEGVLGLAAVVPAEKLSKWVEADWSECLELRADADRLRIEGGGQLTLSLEPGAVEGYPELALWPEGEEGVLLPRIAVDDLVAAHRFCSTVEVEPVFTKVVHVADGWLIASNGHRLIWQVVEWARPELGWFGGGTIGSLASLVEVEGARVAVDERRLYAKGDDYLLAVRREEGVEGVGGNMAVMVKGQEGEMVEISLEEVEEVSCGMALIGSLWDKGEKYGKPSLVEIAGGKARLASDAYEVEAEVPRALPVIKTYHPGDVEMIAERAKQLAGGDGKVTVSGLGKGPGMRLRVEGVEGVRAEFLVTGIQ